MKTRTRPGPKPKPRVWPADPPIDFICGQPISDPGTAKKVVYGGRDFYFCCRECAGEFVTVQHRNEKIADKMRSRARRR